MTSKLCGTPDYNEKRCVAQLRPGCSLPRSAPQSHNRTLRGHVATELVALLEAAGSDHAVLCAAFPREGRATVGGYQLVRGVPVHRTARVFSALSLMR